MRPYSLSDDFLNLNFNARDIMDPQIVRNIDKRREQLDKAIEAIYAMLRGSSALCDADDALIGGIMIKHVEHNYSPIVHDNVTNMCNFIFKTVDMSKLELLADITFSKWLMEIIPEHKSEIKIGLGARNLDDMFIRAAYEQAVKKFNEYEVQLQPSDLIGIATKQREKEILAYTE